MGHTIKVKKAYDFGSKIKVKGVKKVTAKKETTRTYKYALVKFLSTKDEGYADTYLYENPVGAKKYDAVIVPTRYGLSLAVVDSLTDSSDSFSNYRGGTIKAIAEVIESAEVEKVTLAAKKKDLKKKLDAQVKKMDEIERYKMYAANNPAFAELLDEFERIA